jgi:hypothetical protein
MAQVVVLLPSKHTRSPEFSIPNTEKKKKKTNLFPYICVQPWGFCIPVGVLCMWGRGEDCSSCARTELK